MAQEDILFYEKQRFNQWWIWLLLVFILLISVYGIYQQVFLNVPFGNNPASDGGLLVFLLFSLGMMVFFRLMHLETTLNATSIEVHLFPLLKKRIGVDEIQSARIIHYRFIGYGIRPFTSYGVAYNIKGRIGLQLELDDGRKYLIGTQKAEDWQNALKSLIGDKLLPFP